MIRRKHASEEESEINVTPLMDIVFIMLIFFIVTATFTREKGIDVRTPEDTPDTEDTQPAPVLLLSVQADGFVRVNNVRIIDPLSTKPVVEEFTAREPKGVVIVNAAPNSKAGVAVTVMDQARAGNAAAVTLALQKD
ncbi:MAG TPA: biopolymer transporter ExbD [Parvularculaceae bacterium]|nr:biopolymer transporter ExbD [Caulobacterales bacterium]HPE31626.1 biopolymer transporter ExbD [Parvularculaceae bacterium]HRX38969.1 biopolymer transporter ExbD [Parvularculaceae bacterium]